MDAMTAAMRARLDDIVEGRTMVDVIRENAERYGDLPSVHWKSDGAFEYFTWSEYRRQILIAAAGLQSLGVKPEDFVAIQASNRVEHALVDFGVVHAGATPITVYSTLAGEQVRYIANDCKAVVAVVEDPSFVHNWKAVKESGGALRYIVLMEGVSGFPNEDWIISYDELMDRGRALLEKDPEAAERTAATVKPESLVTLIYTSGTTGTPKGVMISHRNVLWTVESVRMVIDFPPNTCLVSYLPLAHIAERLASQYLITILSGKVYYCPVLSELKEVLPIARPEALMGVPRVYEKFYSAMMNAFEENPKRDLIMKALENALEYIRSQQNGNSGPSIGVKAKHALFDKLVFSKVRRQMGLDRLAIAATAAAPIDSELIVFFNAIGVPLVEIYGMSEDTGPATINPTKPIRDNHMGTVGRPLPGVEIKIAEDGEILMRGGIVAAGYYNLPEASAETFDPEGWLHSGDIGKMDDGYLSIIGRKKEILITAAGKNVAPARLETLVKGHPLVAQACMVGDRRKYMTMLVALDAEEAPKWAENNGIEYKGLPDLTANPKVIESIQKTIDEANREVARAEQVKRFTIVPDEWTPESGEITASLKLKRRVVIEKYGVEIEDMYVEDV